MFRSEKMSLCQLFLQSEAAYKAISELGEAGCMQFRDLNEEVNSFQRPFVAEIRRCDELERQIHYIENELMKDGFKLTEIIEDYPPAPNPKDISELEVQLEKAETEILELAQNDKNIRTNHLELMELRKVLEDTQGFFSDQEVLNLDSNNRKVGGERGGLGFVAGVINRERVFAFERMLWRISRGNIYLKRCDLQEKLYDPTTGNMIYKSVFVVFFQGEQLQVRIKKVCTGFRASMYPCPSAAAEREDMLRGVRVRIEDLKTVLAQSEDHRNSVLVTISKHIPTWVIMVKKMKAIYHILSMFSMDLSSKCLIGEGWVPAKDLPTVQNILAESSAAVGSQIPCFLNVIETSADPPTYYRTNKFTRGFQNLIDAYGVASYREVNPALYTCITFPFLFAVMFGDLGHGFILFLFGLWMVVKEKKLSKIRNGGEIWNIFFAGRYIIMLMGIFAMYTGFLYNDCYSRSLNVFGSKWRVRYNRTTVLTNPTLQLNPEYATVGVYPLGMDPIWQFADNKIIFSNSYKMKLSIIIGVIHMVFGVCMSVVNFVHFKRAAYILLEFLPQVLFLLLLFGYMVFMMFFKWVKYSPTTDILVDTPGCSPSVLIMFINMMLFKANDATPGCDADMYKVQPLLEKIFVIVAVVCIPWMLIGKPIYIQCTRKAKYVPSKADELDRENPLVTAAESGHDDEEPMSEIWIHQAIHTVEYVLSTISHTASYLRLWALSLAHAELSDVLWTMVLDIGLNIQGFVGSIGLFIIFAIWAVLTIAIMILMEGLSAFLHTLRLHWVEFMSKFYEGAGVAFYPFSFKTILEERGED